MERAARQVDRTEGRGTGLIRLICPVVPEATGGVGDHVVPVPGEPVAVPVPLVRSISLVARRLPLMLVVPEAMEHEDQGMGAPGIGRRLGEVHVELRPIETRDLP